MTWAVALLCAGLGTRLRPLTTLIPKPLVPVGDRPLLDHAVTTLHAAGARDFSFNAFHLPEHVQRYVDSSARPNATLRCVVEQELLGTAGGVRGLYQGQEHLVVWNGDIYAPDIEPATVFSFGRQEWPVLLVAPTAWGQGTLGVDTAGRVVRLRGETFGVEARAVDYIGIGVFPRAFLAALPGHGCLVGDGLLPWLAQGKPVTTLSYDGHWSDGGTVQRYLEQNQHWLSRHLRGHVQNLVEDAEAHPMPLTGGQEAALAAVHSYLGSQVRCTPTVRITRSVVGRGGQIVGHGELRRCVVWPGAVATAPLNDAVVLTDGTVVRAADAVDVGGRG